MVYGAFLRGLFEADGTVLEGVPSLSTAHESFAAEVRTLLLTQGLATTTRQTVSGWGGPIFQVRLRNVDHALNFSELIGFIGQRKDRLVAELEPEQSAKKDHVFLPSGAWAELVPVNHPAHNAVMLSLRKHGGVPRMLAIAHLRGDSRRTPGHGARTTSSSGLRRTTTAASSRPMTCPCRRTSPTSRTAW